MAKPPRPSGAVARIASLVKATGSRAVATVHRALPSRAWRVVTRSSARAHETDTRAPVVLAASLSQRKFWTAQGSECEPGNHRTCNQTRPR